MALASLVQSRTSVQVSLFERPSMLTDNATEINRRLRELYANVRRIMTEAQCDEPVAWASLKQHGTVAASIASLPAPAKRTTTTASGVLPTPPSAASSATGASSSSSSSSAPYYDGCLLDMPNFWQQEVVDKAPLLNKDGGFLEANRATIKDRLLKWHKQAGGFFTSTPLTRCPIVDEDEEIARVIIKDSTRTFFGDEHRKKFSTFLHSVFREFGNYGQPMSYLAGLCLLGLTEDQTVAVLRKVNKEYIPGHWAAEATGFALNAYVAKSFIGKTFPEVIAHFDKFNFWPETYMQKILSGLCVHVLPFDLLFDFLDEFMAQGLPWLIKFEVAIVAHFHDALLSVKDATKINDLYDIMKLDEKVCQRRDMVQILQGARRVDLGKDVENRIADARMTAYEKIIGPRLAKAPKEPTFEPCGLCEKEKPAWWCDDCGETICQNCHTNHSKGHTADHTVEKY